MTYFLILFVALWRWWVGRGWGGWPKFMRRVDPNAEGGYRPFPGASYVQYAVEIGVVYLLMSRAGASWNIALTGALGLALIRSPGHGPLLSRPEVVAAPVGRSDPLYNAVAWISNKELRWWAYGHLRYVALAFIWAGAFYAQGHQSGFLLPIAAEFMLMTYRFVCIPSVSAFLTRIAPFHKEATHVQYAEFFGWAWIGAAMALV